MDVPLADRNKADLHLYALSFRALRDSGLVPGAPRDPSEFAWIARGLLVATAESSTRARTAA
jgi:hypothetical protein